MARSYLYGSLVWFYATLVVGIFVNNRRAYSNREQERLASI